MDIKIDGNPGTGNTFQEINIGTVQNYNPNATTVINYNGVGGEIKDGQKTEKPKAKNPMEMRELPPIREQIMLYVSCLNTKDLVNLEWLGKKYMDLWNAILDLPEVEERIYNPGKQQNTTFNRSLVGRIIYYLGNLMKGKTVYKDYNASTLSMKLEGTIEHSVRNEMGKSPSDEITKALDKFLENYLL